MAAVAVHFLVFVSVLLPLHAHFCGSGHGHFFTQFADTGHHGGYEGHNPDNCQICKTHGQLDIIPFDLVSLRDELGQINTVSADYVWIGSVLRAVNGNRAPPFFS